jgi:cellulose biosynthesis protein BcsQ
MNVMKKETLFVAFSTQKGGVGKTTFTVLAASYLYYLKGYQVAVVDCDYPQHSINAMRKRDAELINSDEHYKRLAFNQFKTLGKKAYPILCTSPENAIETADNFLEAEQTNYDIIFFDLPGTVNSEGIIRSLASMDYIFTPITADRVVLESSLSFALSIDKLLVKNESVSLKALHLFWNQVDGREKTDLYEVYEKTILDLELPLLKTFIPDTKRYKKELSSERKAVFRSTLFPADKQLVKGSNLEELITEIGYLIKLS